MWYKNIAGRFFGLVTKHACDEQNYNSQDLAGIAESRGKKLSSSYGFFFKTVLLYQSKNFHVENGQDTVGIFKCPLVCRAMDVGLLKPSARIPHVSFRVFSMHRRHTQRPVALKHCNEKSRHRASTSMYYFAFALQHPGSMDEMERPGCRCVDFIAGEGSLRRHA